MAKQCTSTAALNDKLHKRCPEEPGATKTTMQTKLVYCKLDTGKLGNSYLTSHKN